MTSYKQINSFAVFDLETTGLPSLNFNKTNITELAIHGFPAENVRSSVPEDFRRVNHSLTLQFNPRMRISQTAEEITGLNNYMLEKESHFDTNAADLIINFLKHLRQPVCLVAHNGDRFDFPIFKDAFRKLDMDLPPDVMCVDSYVAFVKLDEKRKKEEEKRKEADLIEEDLGLKTIPFLSDDEALLTTTGVTDLPAHLQLDSKQSDDTSEKKDNENATAEVSDEDAVEEKSVDWQKLNETTPKQGIKNMPKINRKLRGEVRVLDKPPNRRCLNFTTPIQPANPSPRPPTGFYKLGNIYRRLFDEEPKVTHQADADVVLLKDIIYKYGDSFVDWAEANAQPFSSVKALNGR